MAPTVTLPFKQKDIYLGLAEISGLLRIVEDSLEIEYKVKDTTLGFLDSSMKVNHIPFRIIDSVEVEKKWFSTKVELRLIRIPDLDNPFKLDGNSLTFTVKKNLFEKAKTFRSSLMFRVLDQQIDDKDKDTEEKHTYKSSQKRPETPPRPHFRPKNRSDGLENMLRDE